jgi:hypothetical protein
MDGEAARLRSLRVAAVGLLGRGRVLQEDTGVSNIAVELRELATEIERVTRLSRVCNVAWPQVSSLCDFLTLRAQNIELSARVLSEAPRGEGSKTIRPRA